MEKQPMAIKTENLNPKRKIDLSKLRRAASLAAKYVWKRDSDINIILISNQKIRALNRRYLGHDRSTDVIAFPASGAGCFSAGKSSPGSEFRGDIAISSDKALENSRLYGTSFT